MIDPRSQADRILVAQLTGEARHRAKWRPLTGDEEDAAVAELRALAGGRADLLAQVAGIFEGTSEGEPDEPLARSAARLPDGRGRRRGHPGLDRRRPPPLGERQAPAVLRRSALALACSPVPRTAARCQSPVGKPEGLGV